MPEAPRARVPEAPRARVPEALPNRVPEALPNRVPEALPNRVPEAPQPPRDQPQQTPKPRVQITPRGRAVAAGAVLAGVLTVLTGTGVALGAGLGAVVTSVRGATGPSDTRWPAEKVAAPLPAPTGGPYGECTAGSVQVSAQASNQDIYPGQIVDLSVVLKHVGTRPCVVTGSMENRLVEVYGANGELAWTTAHCELPDPKDILLGPGDTFTNKFSWRGGYSMSGNCEAPEPPLIPGQLEVRASLPLIPGTQSAPITITMHERVVALRTEPDPSEEDEPLDIDDRILVGDESIYVDLEPAEVEEPEVGDEADEIDFEAADFEADDDYDDAEPTSD